MVLILPNTLDNSMIYKYVQNPSNHVIKTKKSAPEKSSFFICFVGHRAVSEKSQFLYCFLQSEIC